MRLAIIVVLCACVWTATGDVAHLKAKARLLGLGKHKRGALSSIPSFKLGHDIPRVTHSVLKPIVVNYPPTASVTAVKVPLVHPLRYPVGVGHKVPSPHPHYGLHFPHHTKSVLKPQHFHHHHHHIAPRPVIPVFPTPPVPVPVPAAPLVPIAQPTAVHPIPAPPRPFLIRPSPIPVAPVHIHPPDHGHLAPILPAPVPIQPAPIATPVYPIAPQYPYVIRPGNAVQTSFFATYPRYPYPNFQQLIPLTAPAAPVGQFFLDRPQVPHFHLAGEGVQHQVPIAVEPTPAVLHSTPTVLQSTPTLLHPTQAAIPQTAVHLHPQQIPLDHDGWSPVPTQHEIHQTDAHFPQEAHQHFRQEAHAHIPQEAHHQFPQEAHHHFTQEQGTQVYEHHTGEEQQYHEYQHQLQHHVQQQLEQAQFEQHLNNQHQLNQEYGAPQQQVSQEYGQPTQEYQQHGQEYAQQGQEYGQHGQEYAQPGQEYSQQAQEYAQAAFNQQQLGQEYGVPQQDVTARSLTTDDEHEGGDQQKYHNHIPLGLQLPINRPLEHF